MAAKRISRMRARGRTLASGALVARGPPALDDQALPLGCASDGRGRASCQQLQSCRCHLYLLADGRQALQASRGLLLARESRARFSTPLFKESDHAITKR